MYFKKYNPGHIIFISWYNFHINKYVLYRYLWYFLKGTIFGQRGLFYSVHSFFCECILFSVDVFFSLWKYSFFCGCILFSVDVFIFKEHDLYWWSSCSFLANVISSMSMCEINIWEVLMDENNKCEWNYCAKVNVNEYWYIWVNMRSVKVNKIGEREWWMRSVNES